MAKRRRLKRPLRRLIIALLFLTSIAILLYPTISTLWNQYRNQKLITEYTYASQTLDDSRYDELWQQALEYNQHHTVNTITDTFDENNNYVLTHPYDTMLDPSGNGVMGFIEIPKIQQKLVIFHGTGETALEQGIGHVEGTSLPIGGEDCHSVLAGHRGLPNNRLWTDLDQIKTGDMFFLYILDQTLAYKVDQINEVLPDEVEYLDIEKGRDLCTLVTCTPYGVNSHRLLVRGTRVPFQEELIEEEKEKTGITDNMDVSLKALLAGLAAMAVIWIIMSLSRRKNEKAG